MKKLTFLLLLICTALTAAAQNSSADDTKPDKKIRKKFFNISYVSDKITLSGSNIGLEDAFDEIEGIIKNKNVGLKNNWGISLTRGRSYMLHKTPIARLISIGIDASFFDVTYSNYTASLDKFGLGGIDPGDFGLEDMEGVISDGSKLHKIDYSLQVGPSITITPGQHFTIAAYFRYAPTFSGIYADKSLAGNYASMFVTGASATYGRIGVGLEARFGSCTYKKLAGDLDLSGGKIKTSGLRAFIQFRW